MQIAKMARKIVLWIAYVWLALSTLAAVSWLLWVWIDKQFPWK